MRSIVFALLGKKLFVTCCGIRNRQAQFAFSLTEIEFAARAQIFFVRSNEVTSWTFHTSVPETQNRSGLRFYLPSVVENQNN
jgi:hypothetical protein